MKLKKCLVIGFFVLCSFSPYSFAASTFNYNAKVTWAGGPHSNIFSYGEMVEISYTLDLSVPDENSDPQRGIYRYALTSLSVTFPNIGISVTCGPSDEPSIGLVQTFNNFLDWSGSGLISDQVFFIGGPITSTIQLDGEPITFAEVDFMSDFLVPPEEPIMLNSDALPWYNLDMTDSTIFLGTSSGYTQIDFGPINDFSWPIDPYNLTIGHYGQCSDWGKDANGCYWLADDAEDVNTVWRDVQPFQLNKYKGEYHLGADYNLGSGDDDRGEYVYPTAVGEIAEVLENQCGWGNIIFIKHDSSFGIFTSMYAHVEWLTTGPPEIGDTVFSDEPIAVVGKGAWNNQSCRKKKKGDYPAHLHFEIREGYNINPGVAYSSSKVIKGLQGQIDPNAFISTH